MISMSASWFFVVLSEAISVSHIKTFAYLGLALTLLWRLSKKDLHAVGYAILTMVIVIFLYDQILFRPLIAWSEKFKVEKSPDEAEYQSWLIDLIRGSRLIKQWTNHVGMFTNFFINAPWFRMGEPPAVKEIDLVKQKTTG